MGLLYSFQHKGYTILVDIFMHFFSRKLFFNEILFKKYLKTNCMPKLCIFDKKSQNIAKLVCLFVQFSVYKRVGFFYYKNQKGKLYVNSNHFCHCGNFSFFVVKLFCNSPKTKGCVKRACSKHKNFQTVFRYGFTMYARPKNAKTQRYIWHRCVLFFILRFYHQLWQHYQAVYQR